MPAHASMRFVPIPTSIWTKRVAVNFMGTEYELTHGAIAIAAVTSCTTATDPAMMLACGLVAKHARERGLLAKPWVKRVMAPGSHATQLMLERAGLAQPLLSSASQHAVSAA